MSLQDFSAEEVIIDKYVELKESKQDGDELIHELITKHFLPQGRIVESEMWSLVLNNNKLKTDTKKQLLDYEAKSEPILISRMPKNKNWIYLNLPSIQKINNIIMIEHLIILMLNRLC